LNNKTVKPASEMESTSKELAMSRKEFFLPDLCPGKGLGAVLIISELLALLITIADSGLQNFDWVKLSKVSLLSLWIALLSAMVL